MADDFKVDALPPGQQAMLDKNPDWIKRYQDNPNKQAASFGADLKLGGKEEDDPVRIAKDNSNAQDLTSKGDGALKNGEKVQKEAEQKKETDNMKVHKEGLKNGPKETTQTNAMNPQLDNGEAQLLASSELLTAFTDEADKEMAPLDEEIELVIEQMEEEETLKQEEEEAIADLSSRMEGMAPNTNNTRAVKNQNGGPENAALEANSGNNDEIQAIGGELASKTESVNERSSNLENMKTVATGLTERVNTIQVQKINIISGQTQTCEDNLKTAEDKSKKASNTMKNGGIVIGASVAAGAGLALGGTALVTAAAAEYGIATPLTATCSPMVSNPFTAAAGLAGLVKSGLLFSAGTVKVSAGAVMMLASPIVTYGGTAVGAAMVVAGGVSKGKANKLTKTANNELNQSRAFDEKISKDLETSLSKIPA